MTAPRPDPVQTAADLTEAVQNLTAETQRLNSYGRRNRHLIWTLVTTLLIDLTLTVLFIVNTVRIADTAASVSGLHQASVTACQLTNQSRAENKALWDYLLAQSVIPASGPQRAAALKLLGELRSHVAETFALRDCQRLYQYSLPRP